LLKCLAEAYENPLQISHHLQVGLDAENGATVAGVAAPGATPHKRRNGRPAAVLANVPQERKGVRRGTGGDGAAGRAKESKTRKPGQFVGDERVAGIERFYGFFFAALSGFGGGGGRSERAE